MSKTKTASDSTIPAEGPHDGRLQVDGSVRFRCSVFPPPKPVTVSVWVTRASQGSRRPPPEHSQMLGRLQPASTRALQLAACGSTRLVDRCHASEPCNARCCQGGVRHIDAGHPNPRERLVEPRTRRRHRVVSTYSNSTTPLLIRPSMEPPRFILTPTDTVVYGRQRSVLLSLSRHLSQSPVELSSM